MIEQALPKITQDTAEDSGNAESGKSTKRPFETTKATDRDDLKRKTGDASLYKYYFNSIGWPKALMCLAFVIMDVFGDSVSRE